MAEDATGTAPATADASAAGTTTQNGATASAGPQGTSGEPAADWRASLPEGLRGEKSLGTFKDVGALAQAFVETKKMQGDMIRKPGPNATPEQLAAYRTSLGVPKAPSDYTPPAVPEGTALDQARWERWAGYAHKQGLTPEQLQAFALYEAEERGAAEAEEVRQYARGHDTLQQEWGAQGYAQKTQWAERALQRLATPALREWLTAQGMGKDPGWMRRMDPDWVQTWANAGTLLAEDGYIEGRVEGVPQADEAKVKIAEIRALGKTHPANDPDHPQHRQARQQLDAWFQLAYPGQVEQ